MILCNMILTTSSSCYVTQTNMNSESSCDSDWCTQQKGVLHKGLADEVQRYLMGICKLGKLKGIKMILTPLYSRETDEYPSSFPIQKEYLKALFHSSDLDWKSDAFRMLPSIFWEHVNCFGTAHFSTQH